MEHINGYPELALVNENQDLARNQVVVHEELEKEILDVEEIFAANGKNNCAVQATSNGIVLPKTHELKKSPIKEEKPSGMLAERRKLLYYKERMLQLIQGKKRQLSEYRQKLQNFNKEIEEVTIDRNECLKLKNQYEETRRIILSRETCLETEVGSLREEVGKKNVRTYENETVQIGKDLKRQTRKKKINERHARAITAKVNARIKSYSDFKSKCDIVKDLATDITLGLKKGDPWREKLCKKISHVQEKFEEPVNSNLNVEDIFGEFSSPIKSSGSETSPENSPSIKISSPANSSATTNSEPCGISRQHGEGSTARNASRSPITRTCVPDSPSKNNGSRARVTLNSELLQESNSKGKGVTNYLLKGTLSNVLQDPSISDQDLKELWANGLDRVKKDLGLRDEPFSPILPLPPTPPKRPLKSSHELTSNNVSPKTSDSVPNVVSVYTPDSHNAGSKKRAHDNESFLSSPGQFRKSERTNYSQRHSEGPKNVSNNVSPKTSTPNVVSVYTPDSKKRACGNESPFPSPGQFRESERTNYSQRHSEGPKKVSFSVRHMPSGGREILFHNEKPVRMQLNPDDWTISCYFALQAKPSCDCPGCLDNFFNSTQTTNIDKSMCQRNSHLYPIGSKCSMPEDLVRNDDSIKPAFAGDEPLVSECCSPHSSLNAENSNAVQHEKSDNLAADELVTSSSDVHANQSSGRKSSKKRKLKSLKQSESHPDEKSFGMECNSKKTKNQNHKLRRNNCIDSENSSAENSITEEFSGKSLSIENAVSLVDKDLASNSQARDIDDESIDCSGETLLVDDSISAAVNRKEEDIIHVTSSAEKFSKQENLEKNFLKKDENTHQKQEDERVENFVTNNSSFEATFNGLEELNFSNGAVNGEKEHQIKRLSIQNVVSTGFEDAAFHFCETDDLDIDCDGEQLNSDCSISAAGNGKEDTITDVTSSAKKEAEKKKLAGRLQKPYNRLLSKEKVKNKASQKQKGDVKKSEQNIQSFEPSFNGIEVLEFSDNDDSDIDCDHEQINSDCSISAAGDGKEDTITDATSSAKKEAEKKKLAGRLQNADNRLLSKEKVKDKPSQKQKGDVKKSEENIQSFEPSFNGIEVLEFSDNDDSDIDCDDEQLNSDCPISAVVNRKKDTITDVTSSAKKEAEKKKLAERLQKTDLLSKKKVKDKVVKTSQKRKGDVKKTEENVHTFQPSFNGIETLEFSDNSSNLCAVNRANSEAVSFESKNVSSENKKIQVNEKSNANAVNETKECPTKSLFIENAVSIVDKDSASRYISGSNNQAGDIDNESIDCFGEKEKVQNNKKSSANALNETKECPTESLFIENAVSTVDKDSTLNILNDSNSQAGDIDDEGIDCSGEILVIESSKEEKIRVNKKSRADAVNETKECPTKSLSIENAVLTVGKDSASKYISGSNSHSSDTNDETINCYGEKEKIQVNVKSSANAVNETKECPTKSLSIENAVLTVDKDSASKYINGLNNQAGDIDDESIDCYSEELVIESSEEEKIQVNKKSNAVNETEACPTKSLSIENAVSTVDKDLASKYISGLNGQVDDTDDESIDCCGAELVIDDSISGTVNRKEEDVTLAIEKTAGHEVVARNSVQAERTSQKQEVDGGKSFKRKINPSEAALNALEELKFSNSHSKSGAINGVKECQMKRLSIQNGEKDLLPTFCETDDSNNDCGDELLKADSSISVVVNREEATVTDVTLSIEKLAQKKKLAKKLLKKDLLSKRKENSQAVKTSQKQKIEAKKSEENSHPFEAAFNGLEELKFSDNHSNLHVHNLINVLINPSYYPHIENISFYLSKYLMNSRRNPLLTYALTPDKNVLVPFIEKCIIEALVQINSKKKAYLQGLLKYVSGTMFYAILLKAKTFVYGLSSCCRVFTDICKKMQDRRSPLLLCCKLLKRQHTFSPFLIATIVGIWPELFQVTSSCSEIEKIFFNYLFFIMNDKKPSSQLNGVQWKQCSAVFSEFYDKSFVPNAEKTVEALKMHIEVMKNEDMLEDKSFIVSTVFIMLAIQNGSKWTEDIISNFVIPSLVKYSEEISDKSAFKFFAYLYVDMCLLWPKELYKEKFLTNMHAKSINHLKRDPVCVKGDFCYVITTVVCCLVKFRTVTDDEIPKCAMKWLKRNACTKEIQNPDLAFLAWQRAVKMGIGLSFEDCCFMKWHLLSSDLLRDL